MYILAGPDGKFTVVGVDFVAAASEAPTVRTPRRWSGIVIGVTALAGLAVGLAVTLIALDLFPGTPDNLHTVVSGLPLLVIAIAYVGHQLRIRPRLRGFAPVQAGLLALAFLLWSVYQLFPNLSHAAVLNDGAIMLFTADLALAVLTYQRQDAFRHDQAVGGCPAAGKAAGAADTGKVDGPVADPPGSAKAGPSA